MLGPLPAPVQGRIAQAQRLFQSPAPAATTMAAAMNASTPLPSRRRLLAVLLLLPAALLLAQLFGPRGQRVTVSALQWQRLVEIEKLVQETGSDWCDRLPPGARVLERMPREDPEGLRPPDSPHCRYRAETWRALRSVLAQGGPAELPVWPAPDLNGLPPEQLGAERAGERHEIHELSLAAADGRRWQCRLARKDWLRFHPGQVLRLPVDRWGTADCGALGGLGAPG